MKQKMTLKLVWQLIKDTFSAFGKDKVMKLSAALAYYTLFSMGPLLVVIISLSGIFFSRDAVEGRVYGTLIRFMGSESALQVQDMIKNVGNNQDSFWTAVFSIVALLFGATSIFGEIQDSINQIWGILPKPKKGWVKYLTNRLLSFSIIVSLGFLLLVSLLLSSVIEGVSTSLSNYFPELTLIVFYIVNLLLTLIISALIFGTIFKVLPDAKIKWKDVRSGAIVTAILFLIGKFGISLYISNTNVGSTFGAAGSLVVILVWAYYSSVILYLGAEFTKVYAAATGCKIHPNDYAVKIEQVVVEKGQEALTS